MNGALLLRELRLTARKPLDALLPLGFFLMAAALFPLGIGPEPERLREIAPGVVWVCALLATLLSLHGVFGPDHADGSLDLWLQADAPEEARRSNWLPVLRGQPFQLTARLYWPEPAALSGAWSMPGLERQP